MQTKDFLQKLKFATAKFQYCKKILQLKSSVKQTERFFVALKIKIFFKSCLKCGISSVIIVPKEKIFHFVEMNIKGFCRFIEFKQKQPEDFSGKQKGDTTRLHVGRQRSVRLASRRGRWRGLQFSVR